MGWASEASHLYGDFPDNGYIATPTLPPHWKPWHSDDASCQSTRLLDSQRPSRQGAHLLPVLRKVDAKIHEEDARRLRKYTAFDNFSDDGPERLARAAHHISTSAPLPLIHGRLRRTPAT